METGGNTTVQSAATANALPTGVNFAQSLQDSISNREQTVHQEAGQQAKEWGKMSQLLDSAAVTNSGGTGISTGTGGDNGESLQKGAQLAADVAYAAQGMVKVKTGFDALGNAVTAEATGTVKAELMSKASSAYADKVAKFEDWKVSNNSGVAGSIVNGSSEAQSLSQRSSKTASESLTISKDHAVVQASSQSIQNDGTNQFKQWLINEKNMTGEAINDMAYNNQGGLNKLAQEFAPQFAEKTLGQMHMTEPTAPNLDAARVKINNLASTYQNNAGGGGVNKQAQAIIDEANHTNAGNINKNKTDYDAAKTAYNNKDQTHVDNLTTAFGNSPGVGTIKNTVKQVKEAGTEALGGPQDNAVELAQKGKVKPHQ